MKQPQHLAGPAFEKAADKIVFLENQLSDDQRTQYSEFVERQKKEREDQNRRAAQRKAEFDQAKEKHPRPALNLEPPARIKDPNLRKMALDAQAEHNKAQTLPQTQLQDKLRFLEKLAEDRERRAEKEQQQQEKLGQFRDNAQRMTRERASPEFGRAATPQQQPKAREEFGQAAIAGKAKTDFKTAAKDSALARAFAKAAEKEHGQERDRGQKDQTRGRDRGE